MLDSGLWAPWNEKHDVISKTGNIATLSEQNSSYGNRNYTHKKFGEVWPCGFWVMWADKQTNRHTHHDTLHPSQGRSNKSIVNRRLCPKCRILMNLTKHCSCLDVQLVPPPGELLLKITPCLILAPWYENMSLAVWFSSYACGQINRQTDKQTNILITIPHTPPRDEVKVYSAVVWTCRPNRDCLPWTIGLSVWTIDFGVDSSSHFPLRAQTDKVRDTPDYRTQDSVTASVG